MTSTMLAAKKEAILLKSPVSNRRLQGSNIIEVKGYA
jgi:hypothetical protein